MLLTMVLVFGFVAEGVDFQPEKLAVRRNEILSDLQTEFVKKFNRHGRAVRRGQSSALTQMSQTAVQTANRRLKASRAGLELRTGDMSTGKQVFDVQPFELRGVLKAMNPYQADLASNILRERKLTGRLLEGRTVSVSGFSGVDFTAIPPFAVGPTEPVPDLGPEKAQRKLREKVGDLREGAGRGSYLVVVPGILLPDASYSLNPHLVVEQISESELRLSIVRERRNVMAAQVVGTSEPLVFIFHPSDLEKAGNYTFRVTAHLYTRWVR